MVKLAKAMIPGAIIAIILGFIFNLYFGFHLNGYLFHYAQGLHYLPSNGTFLDPVGTFGLKKLLLLSGYIGLGMVSFGLILGILNNLREGQKRHMIGKVGWLLFGWGIVLTGLALLHHSHINPVRHVQGVVYFGLILGGIGFNVLRGRCASSHGVALYNQSYSLLYTNRGNIVSLSYFGRCD